MNPRSSSMLLLLCFTAFFAVSTPSQINAEDDVRAVLGDWHGTSLCLVKPSACHDEEALYHVRQNGSGKLSMQADKIVDGQAQMMGTSDCVYHAGEKLLRCDFERGYVELTLNGDRLEGAMFLTDKTRWRDIKLRKVSPKAG